MGRSAPECHFLALNGSDPQRWALAGRSFNLNITFIFFATRIDLHIRTADINAVHIKIVSVCFRSSFDFALVALPSAPIFAPDSL